MLVFSLLGYDFKSNNENSSDTKLRYMASVKHIKQQTITGSDHLHGLQKTVCLSGGFQKNKKCIQQNSEQYLQQQKEWQLSTNILNMSRCNREELSLEGNLSLKMVIQYH